jgi:hypothetical protein
MTKPKQAEQPERPAIPESPVEIIMPMLQVLTPFCGYYGGILICYAVSEFGLITTPVTIILTIGVIIGTIALSFDCAAQNCGVGDAVTLLFKGSEAWKFTQSDEPLSPPDSDEEYWLRMSRPYTGPDIRYRYRGISGRYRTDYAVSDQQKEWLRNWDVAHARQACRNGQALRLKAQSNKNCQQAPDPDF